MTERDELRDPPRLLDDATSDDGLRLLLEEARELAPPALPVEVRARVGQALRTRVATSRPSATRGPWLALAAGLALAAIALLVWLGREPEASTPALPPIVGDTDAAVPADAGLDASIDAGPIMGRRGVPEIEVRGNGCGLDVRVPLVELDEDVASVDIVLDEGGLVDPLGVTYSDEPPHCAGTGRLLRRLDAQLFREAAAIPVPLLLSLSVAEPEVTCGHTYAISACARDALGGLAASRPAAVARTDDVEANFHVGRIDTPSGPTHVSELQPRHLVTGLLVRSTSNGMTLTLVDSPVRRMAERRWGTIDETTIELETGRAIILHAQTRVWAAGPAARWVEARRLVRGDAVLVRTLENAEADGRLTSQGVVEVDVRAVRTLDHASPSGYARSFLSYWSIDVGFPHTYFVDGLLVHDDGAREEGSVAHAVAALSPREPVRAMPESGYDCSLWTELVVEALAPETQSIAIVFAPHRGRAGVRGPVDCEGGVVGAELPRSLLESVPASPGGARRLLVQLPGEEAVLGSSGRLPIECGAAYDVIACERRAGGSLARVHGGEGRWVRAASACFARGTEVTTREGARPIESLRTGEHVTSRDPESGEVREVRVRALIPRGTRPIRALELEGGRVLHTTDEHPLFDPRARAFRQAHTFVAGDHLLDAEGREVEILRIAPAASAPVYDLSVEGPHTFFAEGVLAHNY
jgi:hypothetical protein